MRTTGVRQIYGCNCFRPTVRSEDKTTRRKPVYPENITYLPQGKFEDTKGVMRSRKEKERQHNGQKTKYKMSNNDLQNITRKTKDRETRTPLKNGGELRCPEG